MTMRTTHEMARISWAARTQTALAEFLSFPRISADFYQVTKFRYVWKNCEMQLDDPWRFPRPELANHHLQLLVDAPRRPLAVFGPRQTGKTYYHTHDLADMAATKGARPIYVDLWTQPDPLGAINTALATVLRQITSETGRTAVTGVGAMGVNVGLAAPAALVPASDPGAWMSLQFAELRRLEPKRPILLMLDEAQTLGRGGAGDAAMKAVRGLFNAHPGGSLLLLTGSSKSQLLALVGDHSKTAFKLAAHMDFPTLGIGFVRFVAQRYKALTGRDAPLAQLDWAFSQLLHRPGEMIDFIRFWITDQPGLVLTAALDAFRTKTQPHMTFEQQYAGYSPLQKAVLETAASGEQLFSSATRLRTAKSLGLGNTIAPSTLAGAVTALEADGVLTKIARGRYQLDDEAFRNWLEARRLGN